MPSQQHWITTRYGSDGQDSATQFPSENFAEDRSDRRRRLLIGVFIATAFGMIALQFVA